MASAQDRVRPGDGVVELLFEQAQERAAGESLHDQLIAEGHGATGLRIGREIGRNRRSFSRARRAAGPEKQ